MLYPFDNDWIQIFLSFRKKLAASLLLCFLLSDFFLTHHF